MDEPRRIIGGSRRLATRRGLGNWNVLNSIHQKLPRRSNAAYALLAGRRNRRQGSDRFGRIRVPTLAADAINLRRRFRAPLRIELTAPGGLFVGKREPTATAQAFAFHAQTNTLGQQAFRKNLRFLNPSRSGRRTSPQSLSASMVGGISRCLPRTPQAFNMSARIDGPRAHVAGARP